MTAAPARRSVAVVGGGFIGLASALHCLSRGHAVTLFEAAEPGGRQAASYGNAQTFASYAVVPVNSPSIFGRLPQMLANGPLSLSSPILPWLATSHSWRWMAHFLAHCRPSEVEATTAALATLLVKERAETGWSIPFQHLTPEERIRGLGPAWAAAHDGNVPQSHRLGCCYLFDSLEEAEADVALRERHGVPKIKVLKDRDAIVELEPALAPLVDDWRPTSAPHSNGSGSSRNPVLVWFSDAWQAANPGLLCANLAEAVRRHPLGTVQVGARIMGVEETTTTTAASLAGSVSLTDDKGRVSYFDDCVVAGGARSLAVLPVEDRRLVPLDTERGYHVTFVPTADRAYTDIEPLLRRPVGSASLGLYMTPTKVPWHHILGEGGGIDGGSDGSDRTGGGAGSAPFPQAPAIRVAGTVEVGGLDAPPSPSQFDYLERSAKGLLPQLEDGFGWRRWREGDWLGYRPTLPDALPVLGRSATSDRIILAFGHQHVGWTLGGLSGQVVADMVDNAAKPTCGLDMQAFRADRFRFAAGKKQQKYK